ncbi:hypothetical protein BDZ45DRAFT_301194 [Acephala macrosclerotiorum]|nr:hypothetical protein BDZ45DRAFT_301194 [Acephala macrosclerotiorum]
MSRPTSTKCTCSGKGTCSYCLTKKSRGSTSSSLPSALFTNLQRDTKNKNQAKSSKPVSSKRPSEKPSSQKPSSRDIAKLPKSKYEDNSAKLQEAKYGSISAESSKSKRDEISTKSTFKTKLDVDMARRQILIKTLPAAEQKKQEKWAQTQLKLNSSSNCPAGLVWIRYKDGYRCLGGGHMVTDKLLAEGKGVGIELIHLTVIFVMARITNLIQYMVKCPRK